MCHATAGPPSAAAVRAGARRRPLTRPPRLPAGLWVGLRSTSGRPLTGSSAQAPSLAGPWLLADGSKPALAETALTWCNQLAYAPPSAPDAGCAQLLQACRTAVAVGQAAGKGAAAAAAPGLSHYQCGAALGFVCQQERACAATSAAAAAPKRADPRQTSPRRSPPPRRPPPKSAPKPTPKPAPAGKPIYALASLNVMNGNASLRFTGYGTFSAFVAGGLGDLIAEQFKAYHVASPQSAAIITPGAILKLRSMVTDRFCRVMPLTGLPANWPIGPSPTNFIPEKCAPARACRMYCRAPRYRRRRACGRRGCICCPALRCVPAPARSQPRCAPPTRRRRRCAAGAMGLVCDQVNFAHGAVFTNTGSGLAVNGVPLVQAPGARGMALVSKDPACSVTGATNKLVFCAAPPALTGPATFTAASAFTLATARGWMVTSRNATDYLAAVAGGSAGAAAAQFNMYAQTNLAAGGRRLRASAPPPAGSIALGATVIIKSGGTGRFCRVAPLAPAVVVDPYAPPFPERCARAAPAPAPACACALSALSARGRSCPAAPARVRCARAGRAPCCCRWCEAGADPAAAAAAAASRPAGASRTACCATSPAPPTPARCATPAPASPLAGGPWCRPPASPACSSSPTTPPAPRPAGPRSSLSGRPPVRPPPPPPGCWPMPAAAPGD